MNKSTIIFLINPKSGRSKSFNEKYIAEQLSDFNVLFYSKKKDRTDFIKEKLNEGYKTFVAVGGDGTINEIASVLMNTEANLGIIPAGSGNGLARSLNIPLSFEEAIAIIKDGKTFKMDVGFFNKKPFFCTAGLGFDAQIAFDYDHKKHKRGFWNYFKIVLQNYFKQQYLQVELNGKQTDCFLITFANAPQFGNNAYISPHSKLDDGIIECSMIKPHPKIMSPLIGLRLMNRTIFKSKYYDCLSEKAYHLKDFNQNIAHIDGEPITLDSDEISITLKKQSLNVLIP